jgi:hypothetical protein
MTGTIGDMADKSTAVTDQPTPDAPPTEPAETAAAAEPVLTEDPGATPIPSMVGVGYPVDNDPSEIEEGPEGTLILTYSVGELTHDQGSGAVWAKAVGAGYEVVGAPQRVLSPNGTTWQIQVRAISVEQDVV